MQCRWLRRFKLLITVNLCNNIFWGESRCCIRGKKPCSYMIGWDLSLQKNTQTWFKKKKKKKKVVQFGALNIAPKEKLECPFENVWLDVISPGTTKLLCLTSLAYVQHPSRQNTSLQPAGPTWRCPWWTQTCPVCHAMSLLYILAYPVYDAERGMVPDYSLESSR